MVQSKATLVEEDTDEWDMVREKGDGDLRESRDCYRYETVIWAPNSGQSRSPLDLPGNPTKIQTSGKVKYQLDLGCNRISGLILTRLDQRRQKRDRGLRGVF